MQHTLKPAHHSRRQRADKKHWKKNNRRHNCFLSIFISAFTGIGIKSRLSPTTLAPQLHYAFLQCHLMHAYLVTIPFDYSKTYFHITKYRIALLFSEGWGKPAWQHSKIFLFYRGQNMALNLWNIMLTHRRLKCCTLCLIM